MGHGLPGYDYRLRHIVFHKLSPFELSVSRTLLQLSKTLPSRILRNFWVVPAFATYYIVTDSWEHWEWQMGRKNPKDFENDE